MDAGFDVVTCATNHALDRGAEGVAFTKAYFEERNVVCLGIQSAEEEEAQPYRMGFSDTGSSADLLDQFLPHDSGIYSVYEIRFGCEPQFFRLQQLCPYFKGPDV